MPASLDLCHTHLLLVLESVIYCYIIIMCMPLQQSAAVSKEECVLSCLQQRPTVVACT